jgi:hypothetical protein
VLNHYQAPGNDSHKELFYCDLFEIWFKNVPANRAAMEAHRSNFMIGGYYRYDLGEGVSVISLNFILINTKNDKGESQSVKNQLAWLEAQLNDESRRFILEMHIPPGHWYQLGEETY